LKTNNKRGNINCGKCEGISRIYNKFYAHKRQNYIKAAAMQLLESKTGSEFDLLLTHKDMSLE